MWIHECAGTIQNMPEAVQNTNVITLTTVTMIHYILELFPLPNKYKSHSI